MKPLLITSKASFLAVRKHQLMVTDYIARTQEFYQARQLPFDSIIIYKAGGNVSFEAVRFLMQQGIPVIHLNWDGSQIGVTLPPGPVSGQLRLAQYQAFLDQRKREQLARAFVDEKVSKSIDLLKFFRKRYPTVEAEVSKRVSRTETPMGFEGGVAGFYWKEFEKIIRVAQPRFNFPGRKTSSNNMGACDPVNSLLNYGYGILEAKVRAAIQKAGLDPDIGFLHSPQGGAVPLVYDVMELFRWIVDLTVVELIELKSIKPEDFQTESDYKVYVKEEAAGRVVERLSENFNRAVRVGSRRLQFETILELDMRKVVRFIQSESKPPAFECPFSAEDGRVDSVMAQRLLNLTVEERKQLGLSKTTYFYIRRNISRRKAFRLYGKVKRRLGSQLLSASRTTPAGQD